MLGDIVFKNIYYMTYKEFLSIDSSLSTGRLQISKIMSTFCKDKQDIFVTVFIEDRGILLIKSQTSDKTSIYVICFSESLAASDREDICLKRVYIVDDTIKMSSAPIFIDSNIGVEQLAISSQWVQSAFLLRFKKYSNCLYRNPFDLDSKKILYFNKYNKSLQQSEESMTYTALLGEVINYRYDVVRGVDSGGIYYIDDGRLIKACPECIKYLGDYYCIAKYYLCLPTANDKISYKYITVEELSTIVDTADLFLADATLRKASGKAYSEGDHYLLSDVLMKNANIDHYDIFEANMLSNNVVAYETFNELVIRDKDYPGVAKTMEQGFINNITTDFIIRSRVVESNFCYDADYKSGYLVDTKIQNDVYLRRVIKLISNKSGYHLPSLIFTPFLKDYKLIVGENMTISRVLKLLEPANKDYIKLVYDRIKGSLYYLSINLNRIILVEVIYSLYGDDKEPAYRHVSYLLTGKEGEGLTDCEVRKFRMPDLDIQVSVSLMKSIGEKYGISVDTFGS